MKGLTRYMLRQMLALMLFVLVALTLAVWLVQSLRLVDLIVNRGLSLGTFFHLALLILPRFIEVVLPVATFVAVLFVYNRLNAESEMVVMRAAGMSQAALARAALYAGLAATTIMYALTLYIVPAANRGFKDLQFQIRNRFATVLVQDGVFNMLSDRLMVYDMGRNAAGELLGLVIYDTRDPEKPITIFAARGAFVDTAEGPRLFLVNGTRQQREETNGHLSVLTFAKYTLDLAGIGEQGETRVRQPDERYTSELFNPAARPADEDAARTFSVELNRRLGQPLSGLAMAVLPLLFLLPGQFSRRGQSRRVLLACALALVFEFVDVGLNDLSGRATLAVMLIYANALAPLAALAWLVWRDGRSLLPLRLTSRPAA